MMIVATGTYGINRFVAAVLMREFAISPPYLTEVDHKLGLTEAITKAQQQPSLFSPFKAVVLTQMATWPVLGLRFIALMQKPLSLERRSKVHKMTSVILRSRKFSGEAPPYS